MKSINSRQLAAALPLGLSLVLAVACGGKDDNNPSGAAGSGGTSSTSGGSSAKGGSGSTGGSSAKGGSGSSGGDFSTSVPGSKQLGSLTDAEAQQLCMDLSKYADAADIAAATQEFSCRASGFIAALTGGAQTDEAAQASCKVAYDACIATPPETTTEDCSKPDASCTATVAEFEACMSDMNAFLGDLSSTFPSCDELSLADVGSISQPMTPASCTTFEMKCSSGPAVPGM